MQTCSEDIDKFILSFDKSAHAIISHGPCGIQDGTKWPEKIGLIVYGHKADENHPWLCLKPDVFFTEKPNFADNFEVIHTPDHSEGANLFWKRTQSPYFPGYF